MRMNLCGYFAIFSDQCICDKKFIPYIVNTYPIKAGNCGRHIEERGVRWSYTIDPDYREKSFEFLDFIDGNGFRVIPTRNPDLFHIFPISKDRSD